MDDCLAEDQIVRGWRIKLHNRRVWAAALPDGSIAIEWKRIGEPDDDRVVVTQVRLSLAAAIATVDAMIQAINDSIERKEAGRG